MVFPEGVVFDTAKRTYLISKVNSLFLVKSQFMESSLVAGIGETSNFDLVWGLAEVIDFLNNEISGEFLLKK